MNLLFTAFVAVFMIAIVKQLLETNVFLRRLRDAHPRQYEKLGRPRWNIQFGDTRFREAVKYIRAKAFADLDDPELMRSYRAIRRADYTAIVSGAGAVLVTLAELLRHGA